MVTIRDVAERAGVSPATVSRVMNNPHRVEASKRRRILAVVRELGYRPSRVARSLKSKQFGAVALLVADIGNPFFAEAAKTVGEVCDQRDYTLVLCDTDHRPERLLRFLDDLPSRGVDGIVVLSGDLPDLPEVPAAFRELVESGLPVVLGNEQMPELEVHRVVADEKPGVEALVRHLEEGTLFPLVYVGNYTTSHFGRGRADLLAASLKESGHPATDLELLDTPYSYEHGRLAVHRLISRARLPRTIVAASDQIALGVLRGLAEAELRVPDDVAVAGFDDVSVAAYANPPLTTVHVARAHVGRQAAEMLFDLIAGVERPLEQVLPCELVVRESTSSALRGIARFVRPEPVGSAGAAVRRAARPA